MNYFLNNTSYINFTHQNQNDKSNLNTTNTKSIFLDLNNILLNKERNKVKISKNILNNSKNITLNNNKFFNTSYINKSIYNTTVQNNLSNINNSQIKNNVNINININNNNKIIYNKVYEYKKPLLNNPNSKIKRQIIPPKLGNIINRPINSKLLKNVGNNNINNNKNIKFINIQLPKKKILNRYNTNNNNNLFS